MAEIYVTSTANSGSGSLRQAIADAADGDVILFDPAIFPAGQTTAIYLSSYLSVNKSIGIYNIDKRLKNQYNAGLSVDSTIDLGTCVSFKVPNPAAGSK